MIAGKLRQQILSGALSPGQTIPSYRTLMEDHGVTVNTIRQAILSLQSEGWIKSIAGKGCIVARPDVKRQLVGVADIGHSESAGLAEQLMLMHDELDRLNCDVAIRFVPDATEAALADLVAWAKRLDGVLLRGRVPVRVAQVVADAGVPVVQLGELLDKPCPPSISNVTIDVQSMVNLAISHLVSLGHQRIMLCTCRGSRYFDLLSQYYRETMAGYGFADDAREWFLDAQPAEERVNILKEFAGARPPTALLIEETSRARQIVKILNDNGRPVPDKVSVLVISSRVDEADGLSSILGSTRDLLLRGVAMLCENIQQAEKVSRIEKIVAKFVPGRSCGRPN